MDIFATAPGSLDPRRDGNSYTIKKIPYWRGNRDYCTMTQNLRIAGGTVLTPTDSNVTTNYVIPAADLTLGDSLTEGRIHNSGNTAQGYWYNACAASAGTACGNFSNPTPWSEDICPIGWSVQRSATTFWSTNEVREFSPTAGGYWSDGVLVTDDVYISGYWSSRYDGTRSYVNQYNEKQGTLYGGSYPSNERGYYVRCGMYVSN